MSNPRSAVLIRVTHDALIVANHGRPVSRLGVLALCASDLSEKSGREDEQPEDYPKTPDAALLQAIANSAIGVYRADVNRSKRDLRHERGVQADYGGRYLWELLQNADDALADGLADAAELIGTKGLGFISVLEITDRPQIFSRPFAFYFNKADTEELLRSSLGRKIPAPTFEIPHPAIEPPEITALLQEGYATAIRLPFRDKDIAANVRNDVEKLDHRFLLLLQHVTSLQIDVLGRQPRKVHVGRRPVGSNRDEITLTMRGTGLRPIVERWCKWSRSWESEGEDKRLSVAVCLPLDGSNAVRALEEDDKPPVHVFFPTDETVGVRALVHASMDVTENRKHFRASERNLLIFPRMRELVAEIIADIPAAAALDAFGCVDPKAASGAARELASTILEAVKETPFVPIIGEEKVRPREAVVWSGNFGTVLRHEAPELKKYRLLHPSVSGRNMVLQTLQAKAIGPHEFFGAMRFCRNGSPEECERTVDVMLHEGVPILGWNSYYSWLEQVPCWWTEAGLARSIAGGTLLFSRPRNWPKSVPSDGLSLEARRQLTAIDTASPGNDAAKQKYAIWRNQVFRRFVHRGEYLEKALLPAMEAMKPQDWDEHGWDILRWYREWSPRREFDEVSGLAIISSNELDDADVFRRRLSRALWLPTDKGWRAAEQCYAGRTWGGPKSFREYFKDKDDRAVVKPLRTWRSPLRDRADLDSWKGLMRFAGVAWEPKLVPFSWGWSNRAYAARHLADFNRSEFDLQIEHFPQCLAEEGRLLPLLEIGQTLLHSAQKYPARYIAPSKQKSQALKTNFAQHQLETAEWLPHKKSLLFPKGAVAARDAYLAGHGIEGLLPEITVPDVEPRRKNELMRFLRAIGLKHSLPRDGAAWTDWMQRLAEAARQATAGKVTLLEVGKTLYRRLFAAKIDDLFPFPGLRVPCYAGGEDSEHLAFVRTNEAKWLDQAIFEAPDIRRALLAHGYRIFILFLSQADGADELLGINRLSKAVSLIPVSAGVDDEGTAFATALYRSRVRALRAVIPEAQRSLLTEDLRIEATAQLSISMRGEDGSEITAAEVRSFLNSHRTLMIAGEDTYHRSLGLGLAHYLVGNPRHTAIFENILSAADEEEVIERLRDQGVPGQELEAVHAEMSREKAKTSSEPRNELLDDRATESETGTPSPSTELAQTADLSSRSAATNSTTSVASPSAMPAISSSTGHSGVSRGAVVTKGPPITQVQRLSPRMWTSGGTGQWDPIAASEAGRHAEDWLYKKLIAAFPEYTIARNERDALNRESDFVISFDARTIHIEVKRLGAVPGYIFWSDLEFAKCSELQNEYFLAVLLPVQDDYEIAWIWRPMADLASAERYVDWIWEGRRSDQLSDGVWQPASPPSVLPRSFTYRVALTANLIGSLPKDDETLALFRSRSVDFSTTEPERTAQ